VLFFLGEADLGESESEVMGELVVKQI